MDTTSVHKTLFTGLLVIAFLLMACSCQTNPITGQQQFSLIPQSMKDSFVQKKYNLRKKIFDISENSSYNNAMTNCGQAIAEAADQKDFAWEYVVLDSDRLDAFCLPGGKIAVKSGLIELMDNEAELAFIVAHEVAHALAEQRGEHQTGERLKKAGGTIVNYATGKKVFELLFNATANAVGAQLPSTLRKKYEEDKAGLELMAKAGYNPQAAIDFLTRYSQESHWQLMNDWTRNNSCDEDRIKALTEALPQAQQVYAKARNRHGFGSKLNPTSGSVAVVPTH